MLAGPWPNSRAGMTEAWKKLQSNVNQLTKEQENALERMRERRAALLDEVSTMERNTSATGKLTDAQKLMLKIGEDLRDGKIAMIRRGS